MIKHPIDVDLLIFDVNGILCEFTVVGQPCPEQLGERRLRPNVQTVLQNYPLRYWHPEESNGTVELALVSNQTGVEQGYLTYAMGGQLLWQTLAEALWQTLAEALSEPWQNLRAILNDQGQIRAMNAHHLGLSVRWCATHPDLADMRRQPNPGMLWEAMMEHGILPDRTLMVGDRPDDAMAAKRANVPFMWASKFFSWEGTP